MNLNELITKLATMDPNTVMRPGFGAGRSWRGSYDEIAFEPVEQATVGEMLALARAAIGTTLHGYKGGEYPCTGETECNIARWGEYGGDSDRMDVWWAANVETAVLRAKIDKLERERAERDRVADALAASEAARQRAREVLRAVEWEGAHVGRVCCPSCGGLPPLPPGCAREYTLKDDVIGHTDGCELARALSADEPGTGGGTTP
jgi:hypothetical protein